LFLGLWLLLPGGFGARRSWQRRMMASWPTTTPPTLAPSTSRRSATRPVQAPPSVAPSSLRWITTTSPPTSTPRPTFKARQWFSTGKHDVGCLWEGHVSAKCYRPMKDHSITWPHGNVVPLHCARNLLLFNAQEAGLIYACSTGVSGIGFGLEFTREKGTRLNESDVCPGLYLRILPHLDFYM
jgi:hypothetical protein